MLCRAIADACGLTVAGIDDRLAPEHSHVIAADECEAAARWLAEPGACELGTERLLIGGDSAGAHLSVLTRLRLRDRRDSRGYAATSLVDGCYDLGLASSARAFGERNLILVNPHRPLAHRPLRAGLHASPRTRRVASLRGPARAAANALHGGRGRSAARRLRLHARPLARGRQCRGASRLAGRAPRVEPSCPVRSQAMPTARSTRSCARRSRPRRHAALGPRARSHAEEASMKSFTVASIVDALGARAPWAKAAPWDPVGLQIGDPAAPVRTVALCHEVTEDVVDAVEDDPPGLLITYHPLLFRPTARLVAGATPTGRALRLARAGIALVVVHTNLDVADGGCADALAEALELEALRGFAPLRPADGRKLVTFVPEAAAPALLDALADAGAGRIGAYTHCSFSAPGTGTFFAGEGTDPQAGSRDKLNREPELRLEIALPPEREDAVVTALLEAHPYEEPAYDLYERRAEAGLLGRIGVLQPELSLDALAARVATALGDPPLRVAGDPERCVRSVAVLPGSGGDFVSAAADHGADCVVTGDIGHHTARAALDRGLCLIDPGHVATERPGLERLLARLASMGVEVRSLLRLDPDPWIG
jgi:dinuclear metal center YbgI/SA1388 family protein